MGYNTLSNTEPQQHSGSPTEPSERSRPEEAFAVLIKMGATEGLATPACLEHLKEFGVHRFSDLKPEMYAAFIKRANEKFAEVGHEPFDARKDAEHVAAAERFARRGAAARQ